MPHVNADRSVESCKMPTDQARFHIARVYTQLILAGMSQQQACKELGVFPTTINKYLKMFKVTFHGGGEHTSGWVFSTPPECVTMECCNTFRIDADNCDRLRQVENFRRVSA